VEAIMGSKQVETAPGLFAPGPGHEQATGRPAPGAGVPDLREAWTPRELSPRLPDDFTRADMRALMERIYALATHI
jgi:hypothetical protein